jgi:hypothetical protein
MGDAMGATLISLLVPGGESTSGSEPISGGTGFMDALASLGVTLSRYGTAQACQPALNVVFQEGQPLSHTQTSASAKPVDVSEAQPSFLPIAVTFTPSVSFPEPIVPSQSSTAATSRDVFSAELPLQEYPDAGRVDERPQQLLEIVIPVPVGGDFNLPEFLRRIDAALAEVLGSGSVELVEQSPSTEPTNHALDGTKRLQILNAKAGMR